jgi:hypothetical protein
MQGLLGNSMDDPRTMAVLQGVMGLLGARGNVQGVAQGLLGYQGAMQQAKQQAAQEEDRAMRRQMAELQLRQAQQQAAQQKRADEYRMSIPSPQQSAVAQALGGGGGPTMANAAAMPPVNPMIQQLHGAMRAGVIDPMEYLKASQPQQAKIKEFQQVRMPDGSVQIVGFDEYGKPVDTGRTPFKPEEVRDGGGYLVGIDPITGQPRKIADKTQSPDSKASNALGWANFDLSRKRLDFDRANGGENKAPAGYRWKPDGSLEPIKGGPADRQATATEGERKAGLLLTRLESSLGQMNNAISEGSNAASPGWVASALGGTPLVGDVLRNAANSPERQRVEAAQLDILDAALTLGTGAAYTREQLEGYRTSFFPQLADNPATIADKQARLDAVVRAARIAAGRAAGSADAAAGVAGGNVDQALQRALRANGPRKPGTTPLTQEQLDAAFNAYGNMNP